MCMCTCTLHEVAFASYFLAQGCMAGRTIFEATESTVTSIVTHLSGFTICLKCITEAGSTSLNCEEVIAMKCVWYNIFAVFLRLLKFGYARGSDYEMLDRSAALNRLNELVDSWWEMEVHEVN